LGEIPRGGESFVFDGRRYTVAEMDRRRVAKVTIERLVAQDSGPRVKRDSRLPS
jgi:CBS domain containing-hemolysin-like protein